MFVCVPVTVFVCVMAGKSSSSDSNIAVTSSVHPDKFQSWSSLFLSTSHHNILSLSSSTSELPREHSLPVHADVSRPFKPVGHNPAWSAVESSQQKRPSRTVSSEYPLPPPTCISASTSPLSSTKCPPHTGSSECLLLSEQTSEESWQQMSLLSEDPLTSMMHSSSDEEDPAVPSRAVHNPKLQSADERDAVICCHPAAASASKPKLRAAAEISMALSASDALPESKSDSDLGYRNPSSPQCYLAPTTKISMALTERTSKIGRRLSTMLHNSRLHQHSSSAAGMMLLFVHCTIEQLRLICNAPCTGT